MNNITYCLLFTFLATLFVSIPGQPSNVKCRHGWIVNGTSCYLFVETPEVWSNALSHCRGIHGASLAEITTPEEEEFIRSHIMTIHPKSEKGDVIYWLGGTDFEYEGEWRWAGSDELVEYTDWFPGQPDDFRAGEDCMEIHKDLGYQWDDRPCSQTHSFICEKDADVGVVIG